MNILIIGKPGSGKGTLSQDLKKYVDLFHLSTGDLLREEVKKGGPLADAIHARISQGQFAELSTVLALVDNAMDEHKGSIMFLDGFPRDVPQLELFLQKHTLDLIIVKEADDQTVFNRITGRLVHPASGRVYHQKTMPPRISGKDDVTGEDLVIRDDDKPEFVQKRLDTFHAVTEPIIAYAQDNKIAPIIFIPESASREIGVDLVVNTIYELQRDMAAQNSPQP